MGIFDINSTFNNALNKIPEIPNINSSISSLSSKVPNILGVRESLNSSLRNAVPEIPNIKSTINQYLTTNKLFSAGSMNFTGSTLPPVLKSSSGISGNRNFGSLFNLEKLIVKTDPLKTYKWALLVPTEFPYLSDPTNVETFDMNLPFCESEPMFYQGGRIYFPTVSDINGFNISFYEDESSGAMKDIDSWKKQIQNADGTMNYPSEYKKDLVLFILNGRNEVVRSHKYIGVFPTTTNTVSLNYSSSGRIIIEQSFSVDNLEVV